MIFHMKTYENHDFQGSGEQGPVVIKFTQITFYNMPTFPNVDRTIPDIPDFPSPQQPDLSSPSP